MFISPTPTPLDPSTTPIPLTSSPIPLTWSNIPLTSSPTPLTSSPIPLILTPPKLTSTTTYPTTTPIGLTKVVPRKDEVPTTNQHSVCDVGEQSERIRLNIGGRIFDTCLATLRRIPDTRLSRLSLLGTFDSSFDPHRVEFFFDRNPTVFENILNYCRTGELHLNSSTCGNNIKSVCSALALSR